VKHLGRHLFTAARVAIGFGLLYYLARSGVIQWSALRGLLDAWPLMLFAFVLLLLDLVVTAWRLCVLLHPRGFHLSLVQAARLTLIGNFFNACLPGATGGDVIKIYYASEGNRGRRTEVATIILFDRAVGMFALLLWPLLAALFFVPLVRALPALQWLLLGATLLMSALGLGFVVGCLSVVRHSAWLVWLFRHLPLGRYAERVYETVYGYRVARRAVLAAVVISLLAHTMTVGITMLCAYATHPAAFGWQMAVLIPLGQVANVVPLTPGNLGVGEAVFNQLFKMAGLRGGAEALIGWRILMILVGVVGLVFYLQGRQRFIHAREELEAAPLEPAR
jgi:hypothetical protein